MTMRSTITTTTMERRSTNTTMLNTGLPLHHCSNNFVQELVNDLWVGLRIIENIYGAQWGLVSPAVA